jgi:DMSO/TMAO reductase YedYZ heme-binding membrane subunit
MSAFTLRACVLATATAVAAIAVGFASATPDAPSWQLAARYTARVAFLLFMPVYVASSWHRLAPSGTTRWLMLHRRSLGLAFACAHIVHLGALTTFQVTSRGMPDVVTLVVGGGAFVVLFAMVATSNDAAVRRLGGRRWQRLHRFGMHYLWFVFAFSYAGRVAAGMWSFVPLVAVALGGLALRIVAARARTRARRPARAATATTAATGDSGSSADTAPAAH